MRWFGLSYNSFGKAQNVSIRPLLLGMAAFLDGGVLCGNGNLNTYKEALGSRVKWDMVSSHVYFPE